MEINHLFILRNSTRVTHMEMVVIGTYDAMQKAVEMIRLRLSAA